MTTRPTFPLLTVFGLGHMHPAPGTWGSLPPVALAFGLIVAGLDPVGHPWVYNAIMLGVVLLFSHVCVHQGDEAEAWMGGKDPSSVVADETAGMALTLMFLPVGAPHLGVDWLRAVFLLGVAFLAFRLFDIAKIPPARQLQRLPGGWGILVDDLLMAVPAWGAVQVVAWML